MQIVVPTTNAFGKALSEREQRLRKRFLELAGQVHGFAPQETGDREVDYDLRADAQSRAEAWFASALALTKALLPDPSAPHRVAIERIVSGGAHGGFVNQVKSVWYILANAETDLDHGLLSTIADETFALTLDGFLDHAERSLEHNRVDVASVLAGVAFEDALRREWISRSIGPLDESIENIIGRFYGNDPQLRTEAKRARAASGLRTSATHARWNEIQAADVEACISFTRSFLDKHRTRS